MAGNGDVDLNKIVVGFPHQGTYDLALANGKTLVITFPRVARSIAVLTPVALRWLPAAGMEDASLLTKLSIPTLAGQYFERVRQFAALVLHNNTGGSIAADTISWDAELTEIPVADYPTENAANGFDGFVADYTALTTFALETPA